MMLVPRRTNQIWDPFREMELLQKEMNRLFDFSLSHSLNEDPTLLGGQWSPAVDIHDSKDNFLVKVDLPGLKKEEIDLSVEDNTLTIRGEKKRDNEVKDDNYYRSERYYGAFCRQLVLPVAVDSTKVEAVYKDGVLKLTLPKKEEAKPKQIKVDIK